MPRRDGTGPMGNGSGTGRMAGPCQRSASGIAGFIIQLLIDNWKPILGFIITTLVPLIGRKLYIGNSPEDAKIPQLTIKVEKD